MDTFDDTIENDTINATFAVLNGHNISTIKIEPLNEFEMTPASAYVLKYFSLFRG